MRRPLTRKGIDLNAASKKPSPETAGAAYNQLGQALAKQGDSKGSAAAYDNAAKAQPAQAGMYMFNEAATLLKRESERRGGGGGG